MNDKLKKEQEFVALVDGYKRVIYKICYMYADDDDHFKDLYQEVLINLWRGFEGYEGAGKLSSWVYRIGLNTCISYFRKYKKMGEGISLELIWGMQTETDDRSGQLKEMYRLINRLNKLEKAIILLWLDEKSYDEIAEITGLSRNNIATKLKRVKEKLATQACQ